MPRTSALAALILTSCSSASGAARLQLATIAATLHASLPRASASTCLGLGSGLRFGLEGLEGLKCAECAEVAECAEGVGVCGGCAESAEGAEGAEGLECAEGVRRVRKVREGACARGLRSAVVGHRLDVHRLSDGKRTGVRRVLLRAVCGRACRGGGHAQG